MYIFYILLSVVAIFSHFEINIGIRENSKKKVLLVLFFIFYLLSFLRWEYGSDWESYYTHFDAYSWGNLDQHEIIYMIVLLMSKSIINDYTFVLFCFSSILFFFQVKGVSKLSVFPLTTLLVLTGTYFCNVGYVRQYIAVAILFYSLFFIIERRFFPFVVCLFLAFGFHYSALAFFPAYWLFNLKFTRKQLFLFIFVSIFLSTLMSYFLQGFANVIGIESIIRRTDSYLDQGYDYDDGGMDSKQKIIRACFNRGFVILLGFYLLAKERVTNSHLRGFLNLYCFGTILFFMTSPLHVTFTRITWYYDFVQILIIPEIFLFVKKKQPRFLIFMFLVALMFVKMYTTLKNSDNTMISEYKFIPSIENLLK